MRAYFCTQIIRGIKMNKNKLVRLISAVSIVFLLSVTSARAEHASSSLVKNVAQCEENEAQTICKDNDVASSSCLAQGNGCWCTVVCGPDTPDADQVDNADLFDGFDQY